MLIQNGVVHTMEGLVIENGFVAARDGKNQAVGPMSAPARGGGRPGVTRPGGHILPGFVDAHCHLGMFGNGLGFEADDGNESTDPCTPPPAGHRRGEPPWTAAFRRPGRGGHRAHRSGQRQSHRRAVRRQVKTDLAAGWTTWSLRAPAAMKFALGENPKIAYNERQGDPITRMATAAVIRENLQGAGVHG